MQGNTRVGSTALYTAQAWRDGKFANAEYFDHPLGRVMYTASSLVQKALRPVLPPFLKDFNRFLFIRHRAFEDRLDSTVPDMVFEIASGLSPRGMTYAQLWAGTTYVELDLPNMVAAKRARQAALKLPRNYVLADTDILADDFIERLPVKPQADQTIVVITEGLMDYLSMTEKQQAWKNIVRLLQLADADSRYLTECWPRHRVAPSSRIAKITVGGLGLLVGRAMLENLFTDRHEAEQALREAGFATVSRPDLVSMTRDAGLEPLACPFVLFECGVKEAK